MKLATFHNGISNVLLHYLIENWKKYIFNFYNFCMNLKQFLFVVFVCVSRHLAPISFSLFRYFSSFSDFFIAGSWLYSRLCVYLIWFASDKWKCQICLCIVNNTNETIFDIRRFTWRNLRMEWGCAFCNWHGLLSAIYAQSMLTNGFLESFWIVECLMIC